MTVTTAAAPPAVVPSSPPKQSTRSLPWRFGHTVALIAITITGVILGIARPIGDLVSSWLIVMALLAAFIVIAGHGIKGVVRGALIDNRNKVSLSRLQMLSWTVLVVSALGVIGITRAIDNPATGLDIDVPPEIWMLMGISLTSLIGSPLLKRARAADTRFEVHLATNEEPGEARWADLFLGEEETDATYLDISKVQMFFFTVLVLLSYGVAIAAALEASVLLPSLPELGEGMLILLGLSHAGYLVGKATPSPPGAEPSRAQQPANQPPATPAQPSPAAAVASEPSTAAGGDVRRIEMPPPDPSEKKKVRTMMDLE